MKRAYFLLNLALVSCLFTAYAHGATITWASGVSGNWSNPTNWSPNQVPGTSDTAAITASGNYTVTVDTSVSVNGLVLGSSDTTTQTVLLNGQSLAIGQSAVVNTNGVINVDNATLDFDPNGGSIMNGTLNCSDATLGGVLTIASNGVVNLAGISGDTQSVVFASLTLTNYGTVVWSNVDLQGSSAHTVENFGLWDARSDNTFYGNTSTFNNYGTVRKDGGSAITTFDSDAAFNNYGTVDVETAQINIDMGDGGGLFNTASNAIVWLGVPDYFNLSASATFTGPGLVGGNLYGDNPAEIIYGSLNFYSGSLGGNLTIASNAVVNLVNISPDTQAVVFASLTLTNYGSVVWSNMDLECSSAQVDNFGLWDAQSDNTFYGSGSTFNNYGTVRKDGGSSITTFDGGTTFNNYGNVDVETAQVNIETGSGGGRFNTANNAIVWLGIPDYFNLSGSATFTGPGLVGGNLYGFNSGIIQGSLNFYYGSLGGNLTVASNAVANLNCPLGLSQPITLNQLALTNLGTVVWSNIDLDCSGVQVYNHGLWDALSDNTFYGNSGGGLGPSTFNNYGTVRKDGGSTITTFDGNTTFNNSGTVDVETDQINIETGSGGGQFNTASNAIVWLGVPDYFNLSGSATFTGPGLVGGNLYGFNSGIIHGSLNFYYGSLGGNLTIANSAVANLSYPLAFSQPITLSQLALTNCGTVVWSNIDLDCSSVQVYNHGLWDALSDNTFYGNSGGGLGPSTFNNYGTVRKNGGSTITTFDGNTTFNNSGTVDVETDQINIETGSGGGQFNTASNAIVWLGIPDYFNISGSATFTGPGLVGGNLYGFNSGIILGSLNFYYGSLGGNLTIANGAVANLSCPLGFSQPITLNQLALTNCGTVVWSNIDLDCSSVQVYNHGLFDALSDNTFYGNSGGGLGPSTFNNYGTVRKDGGSTITTFDGNTTFNNSGTVDVEADQINIETGSGGGQFNTASNAIVWLGIPDYFNISGSATFTGPGLVGGNLYGFNSGIILGSLNFYYGSLGGTLTVASNAVANLSCPLGLSQPITLDQLALTNCGTVVWSNIDLDCFSVQVYNQGLWDARSDNTFYGNSGGGGPSTFNNCGTVRKNGGSAITTFDNNTLFENSGTVDVETAQMNIDAGSAGGGLFNTASNAIVWLGFSSDFPSPPMLFNLSGSVTFTGPGLVGGNLVGPGVYYPAGTNSASVIHGLLNFYYGSLGGALNVASNAVANLIGVAGSTQPLELYSLSLTNCGTVVWSNIDLDCTGVQIYNQGLWDALSDNTFYGNSGGGSGPSTFNNCGTVRKDAGSATTTFDGNTTFNNSGKTDVQKGQVTLAGSCSLTNGTLNFGICGPSQFGSIDFPNNVQLAGRLSVNLGKHYTPAVSNSFAVVVYGAETGTFSGLSLPPLPSGLGWQTNVTSTAFTLSVVAAPALQLSTGLSVSKNAMSLSWDGLLGQTYQVQCATNLAPANWVDLGDPIAGTNGPITVLDSLSASPNKYYRIQSQ